MQTLNLPPFEAKTREIEGKIQIFDRVRKKYVALTPEEWVRQHLLNLLVEHLQYPAGSIRVEGGLRYDKLHKRSDILVYKDTQPFFLIECKAPEVAINKQTIAQASIYNKTLKAPYMAVSNGLKTLCFAYDWTNETALQVQNFPNFLE